MLARRISAGIAIAAGLFLLITYGFSLYYAAKLHQSFELSDLVTVISVVVLLSASTVALLGKSSVYLVAAWAWMAGVFIPRLLQTTPPPPAYLGEHRNDPQVEAILRHGWEFGLRFTQYVTVTWSIVAIVGLCLGFLGEKLVRISQSPGTET
jgi:hypothetical protein